MNEIKKEKEVGVLFQKINERKKLAYKFKTIEKE